MSPITSGTFTGIESNESFVQHAPKFAGRVLCGQLRVTHLYRATSKPLTCSLRAETTNTPPSLHFMLYCSSDTKSQINDTHRYIQYTPIYTS